MILLNTIAERIKDLIYDIKDVLSPPRAEADGEEEGATGNPITDLYNKALTHPATTLGLLAAAIGVGATIAYVVAEQRAQKDIAREMEREALRLRKRMRDEALPRVKTYRRKYRRGAKRWLR
jgi:hypothetical protein